MMNVYVPWAREHSEARAALAPTEPHYVSVKYSQFAYWYLVESLWTEGKPFTLVEHDVVVRPDTISELDTCPHPWCAFKVTTGEGWVATFGCVRFHPSGHFPVPDPTRWQDLDWTLEAALVKAGWVKHLHEPILDHVNPGVVYLQSIQP